MNRIIVIITNNSSALIMIYSGMENSKKAKVKLTTSKINKKIPPVVPINVEHRSVCAFTAMENSPETVSDIKVVIAAIH